MKSKLKETDLHKFNINKQVDMVVLFYIEEKWYINNIQKLYMFQCKFSCPKGSNIKITGNDYLFTGY